VSGQRLRLTTSRPAGYRRGGQVIGGAAAPTFVEKGEMSLDQVLAVLRDPNVAIAIEIEEGVFNTLTSDERAALEGGVEVEIEARRVGQLEQFRELQAATAHETKIEVMPASASTSEPDLPDMAEFLTNTAEPQGAGSDPDAEASKAGGPDATANASPKDADGSAADDGTIAPVKPEAAAPAPEKPAPAKPIRSGKRKTAAA
jgi:hypothetical protein